MAEHIENIEKTTIGKSGLVFFGIVEIIIGVLCLLLLLMSALAYSIAGPAVASGLAVKGQLFMFLFYTLAAAFFITVGIGSILARRWARALMLMASVFWLLFGSISLLSLLFMLPHMYENMPQAEQMGSELLLTIKIITLIFSFFLYLILPAIFFLFYRREKVRVACEMLDPRRRWTDRPLPALSLALLSSVVSLSMVLGLFINVIPFFGVILTGFPAFVYEVAAAAISGWCAWELFHLRMRGWLALALSSCFIWLSWLITLAKLDMMDLYAALGSTSTELQLLRSYAFLQNGPAHWSLTAVSIAVWVGYLWFARKSLLSSPRAAEA